MKNRRILTLCLGAIFTVLLAQPRETGIFAQTQTDPLAALAPDSLREWLTYLASDELEGRATFSEGLGLAGAYIADRLKDAGVKPGGDNGSYFQRVSVLGVQSTSQSTVTVEVGGQTRVFSDGAGVTFPRNVGGKRTLNLDEVEFVGYGLNLGPGHNDYAGRSVRGKAVVWLGQSGPVSANQQLAARLVSSRTSIATEEMGAAASISPESQGFRGGGGNRGNVADFTTVQRLDLPQPPGITVSDEFLEFLFSASGMNYADLKAKAERREDLPSATLKGVKLTFNLDATYRIVNTRYTRNVVGVIEGSDAQLKNTYVAFGGHYDHLGYSQGAANAQGDRISNGADDDGSGSAALIGLARAFAAAPKTRRSLIFVWHAGEELGLYGSKYLADHPPVPIESIVSQLNIDMIGRNRDNKPSEENSVYTVGADRISTELHNILMDANARMTPPLTINLEMNDPTDPERIYFRSDHFSYAAKGIPVIFFFTGLHPDYHAVTDSVEKIHFEKMARIVRLVYETGRFVANLDHAPVRDFKGPQTGGK